MALNTHFTINYKKKHVRVPGNSFGRVFIGLQNLMNIVSGINWRTQFTGGAIRDFKFYFSIWADFQLTWVTSYT